MIRVDGDRVCIRGTRMDYICEIATLFIALAKHDTDALKEGVDIAYETFNRPKVSEKDAADEKIKRVK